MDHQSVNGPSSSLYLRKKTCNRQYLLPSEPLAYSASNNETRSGFPSLNFQEGELIDNIIKEELQKTTNKSDYMPYIYVNLSGYPALSTLNELIIDDRNDVQADRQMICEPDRESISSFRTVHLTLSQ